MLARLSHERLEEQVNHEDVSVVENHELGAGERNNGARALSKIRGASERTGELSGDLS